MIRIRDPLGPIKTIIELRFVCQVENIIFVMASNLGVGTRKKHMWDLFLRWIYIVARINTN